MKTFNLTLLFTLGVLISSAQMATPNDSVLLNAGYASMVYYRLSDGQKTVVNNTDWHLAISVRPTPIPPNGNPLTGVTIRINEQNGVKAVVVPNANASDYDTVINKIDTANIAGWTKLHDSDAELDMGALNSNAGSNQYDFGWGMYNDASHDVVGDSIFVITMPNGERKKVLIQVLGKDTAYDIKYANLDGQNARTFHVSKSKYAGRNFVYLNLQDYSIRDKEPMSNEWDLLFTRYTASDVPGLGYYPVVGVLLNKKTTAAKVTDRPTNNDDFTGLTFSGALNTIGWDVWKTFNMGDNSYTVHDSVSYFVRTQDGNRYHLAFTRFGGPATGSIAFHKSAALPFGVGIADVTEDNSVAVYPNPANNQVTVFVNTPGSTVKMMDLSGRVIAENKLTTTFSQFNTSEIPNGIYLINISNSTGTISKKLIVTH